MRRPLKYNISAIYNLHKPIRVSLRNPNGKLKLENQVVYCVPCETYNKTYVGQTNKTISARVEEHKLNNRNKQIKSALLVIRRRQDIKATSTAAKR